MPIALPNLFTLILILAVGYFLGVKFPQLAGRIGL